MNLKQHSKAATFIDPVYSTLEMSVYRKKAPGILSVSSDDDSFSCERKLIILF